MLPILRRPTRTSHFWGVLRDEDGCEAPLDSTGNAPIAPSTYRSPIVGLMTNAQLPSSVSDVLHRDGCATTAQLRELGLSDNDLRRLVRRGLLLRARSRFLCTRDTIANPVTHSSQPRLLEQAAAIQCQVPDAVVGFRTAALAWGLPVRTVPSMPEAHPTTELITTQRRPEPYDRSMPTDSCREGPAHHRDNPGTHGGGCGPRPPIPELPGDDRRRAQEWCRVEM